MVQEDGGWEEPEDAWEVDETEEEEAMIVNTIQQVESSWQETGNSWLELGEEEDGKIYCVRTCQGEGEAVETGWWSPTQGNCSSVKGRSISSTSIWAVQQRTKACPERQGCQKPQVQQAARAGRRRQ
jgi:hypothetical protein